MVKDRMRSFWLRNSKHFLKKARNGPTFKNLLESGKVKFDDHLSIQEAIINQAKHLINFKIKNVFALLPRPRKLLLNAAEDTIIVMEAAEDEQKQQNDDEKEDDTDGIENIFNFPISNTESVSIILSRQQIDDQQIITHRDLNISDQWPTECHSLKDPSFQVYLFDWLKSNKSNNARFPPDSTDDGKEWNNDAYEAFLKQILELDKSRIHGHGCFIQEGYCLNDGDLLLFPGLVHFEPTRDGYEIEVSFGKRQATTSDTNTISPICAGLAETEKENDENDDNNDCVFIVPEQRDLLRFLNDSKDNKQVLFGLSNRYTFIFKAHRRIVGVPSRIRVGKRSLSITKDTLDKDGELTLNYGPNYFLSKPKTTRAAANAAVKAMVTSVKNDNEMAMRIKKGSKKKSTRKKKYKVNADDTLLLEEINKNDLTEDFKSEESAAEFVFNLLDDDEVVEVVEDSSSRPEEISKVINQKWIVLDSSDRHQFSKNEIQALKEMKCSWFYFDYNKALHLGNFGNSMEKIRLFNKITSIKSEIDNILEDFIWRLNDFLDSQNCEALKMTDIRLVSIPLVSTETAPLVHRSEGNCSASQFDLIAYMFLEELDIEIRDHSEFLEAIWWTYKIGKGSIIDKNFEEENTRKPIQISMNLGKILILHKAALFKIVNRRSGDLWGGKHYAFVSHVVDSSWEGPGNDIAQEYEHFYYKCQRPDTAGRYAWGQNRESNLCWPAELIDATKESYNRICLDYHSGLPCYNFNGKIQVQKEAIPLVDQLMSDTSMLISTHLRNGVFHNRINDWQKSYWSTASLYMVLKRKRTEI